MADRRWRHISTSGPGSVLFIYCHDIEMFPCDADQHSNWPAADIAIFQSTGYAAMMQPIDKLL